MAKTTKRRGAAPPRGPQQRSATVPKAAPASPGGPNRQARKDEARREREALQRKAVRRRVFRIGAIATAVVVVAAAVAVFVVTRPTTAKAAGCGSVRQVAPYKASPANDRAHIGPQSAIKTPPPLRNYTSAPPASGPHNETPLAAGVYKQPPPVDRAIHSLEHGAVEIWYRPSATSSQALADISRFYGQPLNQDHIIVAPYSYPTQGEAGALPAGKNMVLVAWHVTQACEKPSLAVAQDFVKKYRTPNGFSQQNPGTYVGLAPEPGSPI